MLKINQVSKTFGDIKALDDVSFQVSDGEFVFLTGPSRVHPLSGGRPPPGGGSCPPLFR